MKYIVDNDLHIHSKLSSCANDPNQTNESILSYAEKNNMKTICLTDHFWDETVDGASEWYAVQNYEYISRAKPLPQSENVRFLFGCETELNRYLTLGISKERINSFDFIIIPTTHFHMIGYTLFEEEISSAEKRAQAWIKRLDTVLNMDLPFHKIGIAHLTCGLIAPERETVLKVLKLLPEEELFRLFSKAAELGAGIELNSFDMNFTDDEAEIITRPYIIAKKCGCKFYCGSDAHRPEEFNGSIEKLERFISIIKLEEEDKFIIK